MVEPVPALRFCLYLSAVELYDSLADTEAEAYPLTLPSTKIPGKGVNSLGRSSLLNADTGISYTEPPRARKIEKVLKEAEEFFWYITNEPLISTHSYMIGLEPSIEASN